MFSRKDCLRATGLLLALILGALAGCRTNGSIVAMHHRDAVDGTAEENQLDIQNAVYQPEQTKHEAILLASDGLHSYASRTQFTEQIPESAEPDDWFSEPANSGDDLARIVNQAISTHPEIRRMRANTREAWARVPQVKSLPDPMARGTVYGEPMMMADGQTRGTFMISQSIPYLKRLDARAQQASFEALMNQQMVHVAEQRIAADVREAWYRLYLLEQLLRINDANEQLIESLVTTASAQVEVGRATAGDVILATLELSRIEEERLQLRQQLASRTATFNQLLSRPADSPIEVASGAKDAGVDNAEAELSLDTLRAVALEQQPEIALARLRAQATAWGIRVAKLERVPELTLSYEHMFMQMNPGTHGSDPWQLGAGINIPLWHQKYAAIRQEAAQKHLAAHAETEEVIRANEAMLLDFLEQARASERTARLYQQTILPQIRQALDADQRAYGQGAVQFERVIADARNLLTAESAYHRAMTDKAIALARLEQTLGAPLPTADVVGRSMTPELLPVPD